MHLSNRKSINFTSNNNKKNKKKQQNIKWSSKKSTYSKNKMKHSNSETKNYKIRLSNISLKPLSTSNITSNIISKDPAPPISTNHPYLTLSNLLQESGPSPKNFQPPYKKTLKRASVEMNATVLPRLNVLSRNCNRLTTN